jgi:hypothetical protein
MANPVLARIDLPLELEVALDLVAPRLADGPVVAVVATDEVTRQAAQSWFGFTAVEIAPHEGVGAATPVPRVVAIDRDGDPAVYGAALDLTAPGGRVALLGPGLIASLRRGASGQAPARRTLSAARGVTSALAQSRCQVHLDVGIGSPTSAVYGALAAAASAAGRWREADQMRVRYRQSLTPRPRAALANVRVVVGVLGLGG